MYAEIVPDSMFLEDIKCFWILEEPQAIYNRDVVLPDSYTELIINCGAPLVWQDEEGKDIQLPRIFLKQLTTIPLRFKVQGDVCQLISIRLYTWKATSILSTVSSQTHTPILSPDNHWKHLAYHIKKKVRHHGYMEAINDLSQFIEDWQKQQSSSDQTPIKNSVETLYNSQGQSRIKDLVCQSYLSPRQFERRFKQLMKVTPKTFARLVRFEAVRDSFFYDPSQSMVDLANNYGYTDQSHFIHDFKAFAGCTPGECLANFGHT